MGRGCVNSTTTHATSGVQVSCWCGSSSSTCDAQTNMDDVHGGGAAMWWQRGNQSINQAINQERTVSARCFSLSVCRFFSDCCCALVARLPRLSRCCCSRALSVCASSRTRPLASRTWPDIPPLAPIVCISHSSNPPLLVPLVRCCELVVAAPSRFRVGLDRLHIPVTRSAPCLLVGLLASSR